MKRERWVKRGMEGKGRGEDGVVRYPLRNIFSGLAILLLSFLFWNGVMLSRRSSKI